VDFRWDKRNNRVNTLTLPVWNMTDLLLINANIITMDTVRPVAQEVAVTDGVITAIGGQGELQDLRGNSTEVIDVKGQSVLPGFIDAHIHLRALAESMVTLDIGPAAGVRIIADIQSKIREYSQGFLPKEWIRASGYNEIYLTEKRDPHRWDLDEVVPDHPVKLTHRSGYAHVLNSCALREIGISRETPDPEGGIIERDLETGEPTGQFYGCGDFLSTLIPELDQNHLLSGFEQVNRQLLDFGITSVQDASHRNNRNRWRFFEKIKKENRLHSRLTMMLGEGGFEENLLAPYLSSIDPRQLNVGGVKIVLDESSGRLVPEQAALNELVNTIHQAGGQVSIHAIEENAIESACEAIEFALHQNPAPDHRHRIEHCSICPPQLVHRIAELGIVVVTNPAFLYNSGDRYLKTVAPEQLPYLYPISGLRNSGIHTASGSDGPIASLHPLVGVYSAVTRKADNDRLVNEGEKIEVLDALRMATIWAAYAKFDDDKKGSLTPGKLADMVLLDGNPLEVPIDEIKDIAVEMTMIGGIVLK